MNEFTEITPEQMKTHSYLKINHKLKLFMDKIKRFWKYSLVFKRIQKQIATSSFCLKKCKLIHPLQKAISTKCIFLFDPAIPLTEFYPVDIHAHVGKDMLFQQQKIRKNLYIKPNRFNGALSSNWKKYCLLRKKKKTRYI